jgi:hypothetical protein
MKMISVAVSTSFISNRCAKLSTRRIVRVGSDLLRFTRVSDLSDIKPFFQPFNGTAVKRNGSST